MGRISVGEAVSAGFRLIGREPLAFAAWCVVVFVVYGLPQVLMVGTIGPVFQAAASGADASDARVAEATAAMMRYQPLTYLGYLGLMLLLPGAVFRAVLRPEERAVLFLKVGAAELWVLLVSLVLTVGWVMALFAVMLPVILVIGVGAAIGGDGGGGMAVLGVLLIFAAMLATLWPVLRLSLAPVMSFAERSFRLPESWALTKGHAGGMFLVALALMAIIIAIELVAVAVGIGALAGMGVFQAQNPMQALTRVGLPALMGGVAAWSVVVAFTYVLWMASWADIYRQLRPPLASAFD